MGTGPGRQRRRVAACNWSWCKHRRGSQRGETEGKDNAAPTIGQKALVTDTDKAVRQDVEQKAAQELRQRDGQGAFVVAVGRVPPAKGNLIMVKRDQTVVGDGDAVGVAAEILQNMFGAAKRWFAIDDPILPEEWPQEGRKGFRVGQKLEVPLEYQRAVGKGTLETSHELAAKDATENRDRQEEGIARTYPA